MADENPGVVLDHTGSIRLGGSIVWRSATRDGREGSGKKNESTHFFPHLPGEGC